MKIEGKKHNIISYEMREFTNQEGETEQFMLCDLMEKMNLEDEDELIIDGNSRITASFFKGSKGFNMIKTALKIGKEKGLTENEVLGKVSIVGAFVRVLAPQAYQWKEANGTWSTAIGTYLSGFVFSQDLPTAEIALQSQHLKQLKNGTRRVANIDEPNSGTEGKKTGKGLLDD